MATVRRPSSRARTAVFAPLGDLGRATRVEQRLAEAIHAGLLVDGERLPSEPELASMLGVATVTAREALVSLRAQGLVTTVRGRGGGSFVTRPDGGDDARLHERLARMTRVDLADRGVHYATILAGCAELAAERANPEETEDLREIVLPEDVDEVGTVRHADTELHLALAALTHSARLTRDVMRAETEFGVLLRLPLSEPVHRGDVRAHQVALLDAVATHDAAAARRQMRTRVRQALGELAELHSRIR
ncbi:GntR family transcriptional regulator [Aeromicrobium sp. IC_218]|uniref:FadR/GntR family transcriptional regulator n=1 Tax=Aeromicrobium sp. IC_218 TaxID=2545468 RepID=UPI00103882E7|nr:GntR family transcriptional regulator [Aeromicrobium sp. IC_218]TCI97522.1 FadR family transcriptional regulator [Aeromicrobium sp. IC_218]